MTLVLDASAVVAYLAQNEDGMVVADHLAADDDLPWTLPLVDAEVGQALRGMVLRRELPAARASGLLKRLASMPLKRTGMISMLPEAWALRNNLSFYDALYVSLAAKLEAPLLTFDQRIAGAPKLPARVIIPG